MNPIARWIRAETEERFFRLLDRLLLFAGLLSAAVLIRELGWGGPTDGPYWPWSLLVAKAILIFFVIQGLLRLVLLARPWVYVWQRKGHYLMILLAIAALAGGNAATALLHTHVPPDKLRVALLGFLALSQLPVLGMTFIDFIRRSSSLGFRYFNAGQIFVLTYLLTATLGALLLKTPNATRDPESFTWMQAAFTSTSAVCITGLTVVDVERVFTPVGQFIIMLLIQIGGLGIMSLTYLLSLLAGSSGASLRNRYAMQSLLDERSLAEVSTALIQIAAFMVTIEAVGAFFLFHFHSGIAHLPWNERAFSAAFHAISAFCNAGFSLHSEGMAHPTLSSNVSYLTVIMILVTLGGIGFPVLRNLWSWCGARWRGRPLDESSRLQVHTKVVLIASACLTLGGSLFFWIEHTGPENDRLLHALFLSAASRTSGFIPYDPATISSYALAGLSVLMFIGGSPGGTAGGVRTTTITILLLDVWRVLRGRESQIIFERKISRQVRDRALATVILSLAVLAAAAALMRWLEPGLPAEAVLFECVSAFSTTGLSLNLTPRLSEAGQAVLMVLMLSGRIGILLLATSLLQRPDSARVDHPRGILQI
jgi:trk system potassium uptake protein TrkH